MTALFSGTIYFAHVTFQTPTGNFSFSAADIQTMVTYAQHAIVPISEYVQQYGPSSASIFATPIEYTANMSSMSFTDSDLQGWVNDIIAANGLSTDSCIVVPCPQQISDGIGGNSGYHGLASVPNVPYVVFGVDATGLTLQDQPDVYAMVVSHEIAEMIVDPQVNGTSPEVCDPCCINCLSDFYRAYFDAFDNYLGTNQMTPPGGFAFAYYIAVVVKPEGAADCPADSSDCNYAPSAKESMNMYLLPSVIAFKDAGFNQFGAGAVFSLPPGWGYSYVGDAWNDSISSVIILSGTWKFENAGFTGASATVGPGWYQFVEDPQFNMSNHSILCISDQPQGDNPVVDA